ncbi:hypothetical protein [Methyloceanibacter superfactus]|uniref:hypothetical protein n=1 Tax=Methyloceanibacter superfactus TaxID=1774969 RepID=UPI00244E7BCC|nr:hypothetical protein [Methyloceanibacter superfactus]
MLLPLRWQRVGPAIGHSRQYRRRIIAGITLWVATQTGVGDSLGLPIWAGICVGVGVA